MERIALHTRIAEGREGDYDREHARIPDELDAALRAAGVHEWRIWRDGRDIFHVVEVEDYSAMRRRLAEDPANQRWQEHINQFLEVVDDYGGGDSGIRPVWSLPPQPPQESTWAPLRPPRRSRCRASASAPPSWGTSTGRRRTRRPTARSPPRGTPGSATSTPPRTAGSAPANAASDSAWPGTRARST